jgi:hypothetical protein
MWNDFGYGSAFLQPFLYHHSKAVHLCIYYLLSGSQTDFELSVKSGDIVEGNTKD